MGIDRQDELEAEYGSVERGLAYEGSTHVITKAEAEYALDREEFDRLLKRRGADTILTWWYQTTLKLPRQQATDMDAVRRG
jgi:hypothetical protein